MLCIFHEYNVDHFIVTQLVFCLVVKLLFFLTPILCSFVKYHCPICDCREGFLLAVNTILSRTMLSAYLKWKFLWPCYNIILETGNWERSLSWLCQVFHWTISGVACSRSGAKVEHILPRIFKMINFVNFSKCMESNIRGNSIRWSNCHPFYVSIPGKCFLLLQLVYVVAHLCIGKFLQAIFMKHSFYGCPEEGNT